MPRPSKFPLERILDAARDAAWQHGRGVTINQVADELGAPVGSIYHRFASRDELLVTLWLRAVRRFQAPLLTLLDVASPAAAIEASALHIPRYCRAQPAEAHALTLFRHARLVEACPPALHDEVVHVNDTVTAALETLARRHFDRLTRRRLELVETASRQAPYGLVRPYVGTRTTTASMPTWMDDAVLGCTRAILALA